MTGPEPEGRFSDWPRDDHPVAAADRPIWKLSLRAEPGINPIRALRWILKSVLRQHGMRCVDIRREPPT